MKVGASEQLKRQILDKAQELTGHRINDIPAERRAETVKDVAEALSLKPPQVYEALLAEWAPKVEQGARSSAQIGGGAYIGAGQQLASVDGSVARGGVGARIMGSKINATGGVLTRQQLEDKVLETTRAWHQSYIKECYATDAMADPELLPVDLASFEEGELLRNQDMEEHIGEMYDELGHSYKDRDGNKVPKDAVAVYDFDFMPELLGIGLTKSYVMDRRSGDVLDDLDVSDGFPLLDPEGPLFRD